ncbi:hypothetical protein D3C86_868050 [compost metagenome]
MCTCGIAIATQQATPATHSRPCAVPMLRPKGRVMSRTRVLPATCDTGATSASAGGRARKNSASSAIVTPQKMPMPM